MTRYGQAVARTAVPRTPSGPWNPDRQVMSVFRTTIFPGRYVQGVGAMARLGQELKRFGPKALAICSPFVCDSILPAFRSAIEQDVELRVARFGGECCDDEIERVAQAAREFGASSIAGIGGQGVSGGAARLGGRVGCAHRPDFDPGVLAGVAVAGNHGVGNVVAHLDGRAHRAARPGAVEPVADADDAVFEAVWRGH